MRAMHNAAPPADDLALAMKETEGVDLRRPVYLPLGRRYTPRTQRAQRDFAVAAHMAELNMMRAAKCKGKSWSQSNLALAFQSLIGSPNRVRTQRTTRAAQ